MEECASILKCFRIYELATDQKVNLSKSAISFSRNVDVNTKREIQQLLDLSSVRTHDKYLGSPMIVRKSKTNQFKRVNERVWKTL